MGSAARSSRVGALVLLWVSTKAAGEVASVSLAPVSPLAEDAPLFELMVPERTGVVFENRYDHPQRWRSLWRQYFIGSIGTGIALGDVNGDELPDIFLVGKDSPNVLYLNRGDFTFEDRTETSGLVRRGEFGAGAAMVDVDNDGDLDIYVCYVGSPNELYLNDGHGVFREAAAEWGLDIVTGSNAPSFVDFDRDGDLDLYLQCNYWEASGRPEGLPDILLENREGRFIDVTRESGIAGVGQGHAAIWWDYDEDGWPDVYVANDFAKDDRLYRNNQDGTFTDVLKDAFAFAPYSAMGADFGDLNNDGHLDFIVGEMAPRDRAYYLRSVGPLSAKLFSIEKEGVGQFMQNAVVASVGPGRFMDVGFLTGMQATDWTWAPRLVDLDSDGRLDAFFTNGMARAFHDADIGVRVARAPNTNIQVALYQRSPALRESNLAFKNLGDFRFEEASAMWGLDLVGVSFAAAFADFDQDGDPDLVVGNWNDKVTLYRNNGDDGDRVSIYLVGAESNTYGLGAKVTARVGSELQVREMSSTRGYMATDEPLARFAFSEAEKIDEVRIEWPSGKTQTLSDLPTGRRYRIEEADTPRASGAEVLPLFVRSGIEVDKATWSAERRKEVDRDQALLPFSEDREGPPLAVADFDGDGWLDVVLGGPRGTPLRVFRNEEGKRLSLVEAFSDTVGIESETVSLAVADFDGDGRLDFLASNGGIESTSGSEAYRDSVFLNQGGMRFLEKGLREVTRSSGKAIVADFDGNGLPTLLVAGGPISRSYPLSERNQRYEVVAGRLQERASVFAEAFAESGKIVDMAAVDPDGDGDFDLVCLEQWGVPALWRNSGGELEREELRFTEGADMRGYWSSVETGDFDGDGRLDLLLGNLGLNTKYTKDGGSNYELFFSANAEASPRLFIDAVRIGERVYPMETRTLHQMYLPEEMRRTGTYEEFGDMTVEEAFGPEVFAQLDRRVLREPRSLIALQRDVGSFELLPLPHLAQSGMMIDCLAADFDEDGDLDVVAIVESLAPQPWVALRPNQSCVLVLLNDGRGSFETLLPWRSGLEIPEGQPKRLAFADLDADGMGELLVTASDGPLYVFRLGR